MLTKTLRWIKSPMSVLLNIVAAIAICLSTYGAASADPLLTGVQSYADKNRGSIMTEFLTLLSIPNTYKDVDDLNRNARLLQDMMKKRGLTTELWNSKTGIPVVFGEKKVPGATRTILFYAHYDGVDIVDAKRWAQPSPFTPVVRTGALDQGAKLAPSVPGNAFPDNWRIYARSAGDDKVSEIALLTALDAIGNHLKSNIKIFFHGEEEHGEGGLDESIKAYPDRLKADLLVILDGPQNPSGKATIFYGARGRVRADLTVYTAISGLHSGNYGNWMPDADIRLAQLLASMVSPQGKVLIPDYYSDVPPLTLAEKSMLASVPDGAANLQAIYGLGSHDQVAPTFQEALNLPGFATSAMSGGNVGSVIPPNANVKLFMKLVKGNDPQAMLDRVAGFIRSQGYYVIDKDPDTATLASHPRVAKFVGIIPPEGSGAWRTDIENPQARFAAAALHRAWGDDIIQIRTFGGGVPASFFIDAFHIPTVGISIANFDDNQHTDNENIRVRNVLDGVVTIAALLTQ